MSGGLHVLLKLRRDSGFRAAVFHLDMLSCCLVWAENKGAPR